jgi:indolepyruvate decarboxylase
MSISLSSYIATRIKQLEVEYVFGLPGDFNLSLIEELTVNNGLKWVGDTNELNAGYAADAYACANKKLGVLVTTYGVGELSAVNAIAGSFSERGAVLHIVGTPTIAKMRTQQHIHHTISDGKFDHFAKIFEEVTVAGFFIQPGDEKDTRRITEEVDRVILEVIKESRPGYLSIPVDLVHLEVPDDALAVPLSVPSANQDVLKQFETDLRTKLNTAASETGEQFVALAGMLNYRRGTHSLVKRLADSGKVKVALQPNTRTMLAPDHDANLGVYIGGLTECDLIRNTVDNATPLLLIGTVLGEITLGNFTHKFNEASAIKLDLNDASIGVAQYPQIPLEESLAVLVKVIEELNFPLEFNPSDTKYQSSITEYTAQDEINQQNLWPEVSQMFEQSPKKCAIVSDVGTCFFGTLETDLPMGFEYLSRHLWASIGYAVAATVGVGLAIPDLRPVLFTGDGAAQLSVQALGTMAKNGVKPVVFLLDNEGYTIERTIMKPEALYHNISKWDWCKLADAFMSETPGYQLKTYDVRTVADMRSAAESINTDLQSAHFVHIYLDKIEIPRLMQRFFKMSQLAK